MSLNLQNLIDKINTRVAGIDSATSLNDIIRLTELNTRISGSINQGAIQYRSQNQLPAVSLSDSASGGQIAFVADDQIDSDGRFYFRARGGWINLQTASDSDENYSIANPSAGGGGAEPSVRQASNYGFMAGLQIPSVAPAWDHIQKFSLASDADATDVGNVTDRIRNGAGASSSTHGYLQGGFIGHGPNSPARINVIQKYSHTVDGDATDVADLLTVTDQGGGGFSPTHGYQFGGYTPGVTDTIQKFDFASDGDATDVGNLTAPTRNNSGSAISDTHIYNMGGYPGTTPTGDYVVDIEKFPYSADADATLVGDLTQGVAYHGGSQSTTYGYRHGGNGWVPAPGSRNEIDKWPFATDTNATDVGDLTVARYTSGNGVSSTTHGYAMGGYAGTPTYSDVIDKYSHSSDGNATDVGNTLNPGYGGGMVGYGSSQN